MHAFKFWKWKVFLLVLSAYSRGSRIWKMMILESDFRRRTSQRSLDLLRDESIYTSIDVVWYIYHISYMYLFFLHLLYYLYKCYITLVHIDIDIIICIYFTIYTNRTYIMFKITCNGFANTYLCIIGSKWPLFLRIEPVQWEVNTLK